MISDVAVRCIHEELKRVYGPLDEEVRECLANVSSTDPAIAEGAVDGLFELLVGGRVVGRITSPAVPYMTDLVEAEAGDISGLLMLLGRIADTNDEVKIPDGSGRLAVTNELAGPVPFLKHQDSGVRPPVPLRSVAGVRVLLMGPGGRTRGW
ncbi:hypothetical protein ACFWEJ_01220 [Promicromonospora sp. NPDC060204]|uniref:hypothetical protein n=1 Tax=Promicromonospora sp. NPDC060204 TaxID=3347071 RepID=UPI00364DC4A0